METDDSQAVKSNSNNPKDARGNVSSLVFEINPGKMFKNAGIIPSPQLTMCIGRTRDLLKGYFNQINIQYYTLI